MNWFSRQLYRVLKIITNVGLWIYYPKTSVLHRERLNFDKPTIIACSHPNTMMDPLNVASRTKNPVFFLANADLFASKFGNWFYSNFFCIPIRRSIDNKSKHIKNTDSFDQITKFLNGNGCLWVAPEGGSYWGRHWMPLKMGTAKMALLAENANEFQLGVQILPIGLNYGSPNHFQTDLVINVGEGIDVKSYKDLHDESSRKATYQLTKDLEKRLQKLEISPTDEEQDHLLKRLETMLHNEMPASGKSEYTRTKKMLQQLQEDKELEIEIQNKIDSYSSLLEKHKLSDLAITRFQQFSGFKKTLDFVKLILGFPIFLFGWINNFLPGYIPYYIVNNKKPYVGYEATIKMMVGLLTFPLFYTLQTALVHFLSQNIWITISYLLSLLPTGLFAWNYAKKILRTKKMYRIKNLESSTQNTILKLRKEVLTKITGLI